MQKAIETDLAALTLAVELERFLTGVSDGAPLFQALYGEVADEPIPERLLDAPLLCAAAAAS
jgi:hypothetical protein